MEFTIHSLILVVDKLEGVTSVSVHVSVAVGCSTVGEQECHLVSGLGTKTNEIPKHVSIFQIGFRIALLCVNKARKLQQNIV